jgi:hypothetical protein
MFKEILVAFKNSLQRQMFRHFLLIAPRKLVLQFDRLTIIFGAVDIMLIACRT